MRALLVVTAVAGGAAATAGAATPAQLFLSEYVEGSWHKKAVEIYNPTAADLSLDGVSLVWHHNGGDYSSKPSYTVASELEGKTIKAGEPFVICRDQGMDDSQQVEASKCDLQISSSSAASQAVMHNGDDAITLEFRGKVVDIIGVVGEDPGSCWKDANGACMTKDQTIRRNDNIAMGSQVFRQSQWRMEPKNQLNGLGNHTFSDEFSKLNGLATNNFSN